MNLKSVINYVPRQITLIKNADNYNCHLEVPAKENRVNVFEYHPYTKVKIKGFKVPYFKEAIDLVIEASKKIPQIKYVGFDIAISDKGPVIIEGNECPGYDIYQSKMQLGSDKLGLKPFFDEIVYKK